MKGEARRAVRQKSQEIDHVAAQIRYPYTTTHATLSTPPCFHLRTAYTPLHGHMRPARSSPHPHRQTASHAATDRHAHAYALYKWKDHPTLSHRVAGAENTTTHHYGCVPGRPHHEAYRVLEVTTAKQFPPARKSGSIRMLPQIPRAVNLYFRQRGSDKK